jgi:hypothetical protein
MDTIGTDHGVAPDLSVTKNPQFRRAEPDKKPFLWPILSATLIASIFTAGCSNNNVASWKELRDDAETQMYSGHYSRAESESKAACNFARLSSVSDNERAACLLTLGTAQLQSAQFSLAEKSLLQARDCVHNPKSYTGWLKPLLRVIPSVRYDDLSILTLINNRLAQLYLAEAKFAKAQTFADDAMRTGLEPYTVALKIAARPRNEKDTHWAFRKRLNYADALCTAAEVARQAGDYRNCRSLCVKADEILDTLHAQNSDLEDSRIALLQVEAMQELDSGRYHEADKLSQSALLMCVGTHGWYSPSTFKAGNTLAYTYVVEQHYSGAIHLIEKYMGNEQVSMHAHPVHCRTMLLNAISWNAVTHGHQPVVPSFEFAIKNDTIAYGEANPVLAEDFDGFAAYKLAIGDTQSASELLRKSLEILQSSLGAAHPRTVSILNELAGLSLMEGGDGDLKQADQYAHSALEILSKGNLQFTPEWERTINTIGVIAERKHDQAAAESAFKQLSAAQLSGAPVSSSLICGLKNYAAIMRHTARDAEAAQLEARIRQLQSDAAYRDDSGLYRQVGYLAMPAAR